MQEPAEAESSLGGLSRHHADRAPARDAEPRDAARGAPLSGTPVGLHYFLTHYDIPTVDPARWRLRVGGSCAARSLSARRDPRAPVGAPPRDDGVRRQRKGRLAPVHPPAVAPRGGRNWRVARHTAPAAARRGRARRGAVEIVFTGLDWGIEGRRWSTTSSAASPSTMPSVRPAARVRDERNAAPAAAWLPASARRPGLVRDGEREVARGDHGDRRPFDGYQQCSPTGSARTRRATATR